MYSRSYCNYSIMCNFNSNNNDRHFNLTWQHCNFYVALKNNICVTMCVHDECVSIIYMTVTQFVCDSLFINLFTETSYI